VTVRREQARYGVELRREWDKAKGTSGDLSNDEVAKIPIPRLVSGASFSKQWRAVKTGKNVGEQRVNKEREEKRADSHGRYRRETMGNTL